MEAILGQSARTLRRLIGREALSPVELLNACIARIAQINPVVNAVEAIADIYDGPLSDADGGGIDCLHHIPGFDHGTLAEIHVGTDQVERAIFADAPEPEGDRTRIRRRRVSGHARPRRPGRHRDNAMAKTEKAEPSRPHDQQDF